MKQKKSINGRSAWGLVWFRFKKNKLAMCGLIILILLMIPVTILCARILWKLGIVKVLPNPSAVAAEKPEEK